MSHENSKVRFINCCRKFSRIWFFLYCTNSILAGNTFAQEQSVFKERLSGMLYSSIVADAMAGPRKGRSIEATHNFLELGHWIKSFAPYSLKQQQNGEVYKQNAEPGTFTEESRMRILMAQILIENQKQRPCQPVLKEFLAKEIIRSYQNAFDDFMLFDSNYHKMIQEERPPFDEFRKQKYLKMAFLWELTKISTSVFIPQDVPLFSPPYKIHHDNVIAVGIADDWHLDPVEPVLVQENIKSKFAQNAYAAGKEIPVGLVGLLPAAAYFSGNPVDAFQYIMDLNFFDIGTAPFYTAVLGAVVADLLGGKNWPDITQIIMDNGLDRYLGTEKNAVILSIEKEFNQAVVMARHFKNKSKMDKKEQLVSLIYELHYVAVDDSNMCTVPELFFCTVALMEYAQDIPLLIEAAANYGRDNDTLAFIAGSVAGAWLGVKNVPASWIETVEQANSEYPFKEIFSNFENIFCVPE